MRIINSGDHENPSNVSLLTDDYNIPIKKTIQKRRPPPIISVEKGSIIRKTRNVRSAKSVRIPSPACTIKGQLRMVSFISGSARQMSSAPTPASYITNDMIKKAMLTVEKNRVSPTFSTT